MKKTTCAVALLTSALFSLATLADEFPFYEVRFEKEGFNLWQRLSENFPEETESQVVNKGKLKVRVDNKDYINPPYSFGYVQSNPDYSFIGAGDASLFTLGVVTSDCGQVIKRKLVEFKDIKACGFKINIVLNDER
ncbi:hypothetical protein L1D14_03960 [Vibrio tubiashii]|uniref:hypothetical protein n=1 Tax=Vibrio tubiashii TaxID=29498 RepID=UPI001EFE2633|nr:hypothetical protein [Vibrio tubiashii]MCG9575386.1 hypothetical protein [Vibrio tubiashii]